MSLSDDRSLEQGWELGQNISGGAKKLVKGLKAKPQPTFNWNQLPKDAMADANHGDSIDTFARGIVKVDPDGNRYLHLSAVNEGDPTSDAFGNSWKNLDQGAASPGVEVDPDQALTNGLQELSDASEGAD